MIFLQFEHTKEWQFFHIYMTTSVSAYDIIQIALNYYSSRYYLCYLFSPCWWGVEFLIRYILSLLNFPPAKLLTNYLRWIWPEEDLWSTLKLQSTNSEIQSNSDLMSYFRYYGYIRYIIIVTAEEFCKFVFVYKHIEIDILMTFSFLCTSILIFCS